MSVFLSLLCVYVLQYFMYTHKILQNINTKQTQPFYKNSDMCYHILMQNYMINWKKSTFAHLATSWNVNFQCNMFRLHNAVCSRQICAEKYSAGWNVRKIRLRFGWAIKKIRRRRGTCLQIRRGGWRRRLRGLPSRNRIWCILDLKSDIWWQKF